MVFKIALCQPFRIFNQHDFSYFYLHVNLLLHCVSTFHLVVCKMSKTDFQDGGCGGCLGFPINMILAHLVQKSCCYRASFGSNHLRVWEEMLKIDFQDGGCGGHLGFSIGSVLAILCLLGVPMLLIKFQLNWIMVFRGDVQKILNIFPI